MYCGHVDVEGRWEGTWHARLHSIASVEVACVAAVSHAALLIRGVWCREVCVPHMHAVTYYAENTNQKSDQTVEGEQSLLVTTHVHARAILLLSQADSATFDRGKASAKN